MSEPVLPLYNQKDFLGDNDFFIYCQGIRNYYSDEGRSFLWIYDNFIKLGKGYPQEPKLIKAFNKVRRDVLNLYPDLEYSGARSGVAIDWWPGYDSIFPKFQVTKDLRVTLWTFKNSPYFLNGNKWNGEMFFQPYFALTPKDQQRYAVGGKAATRFGNNVKSAIVKFNGLWCYDALPSGEAWAYTLQYMIDELMAPADAFSVWDKLDNDDPYPMWLVYDSLVWNSRTATAAASFLGSVNLLVPPQRHVSLFEKITAGLAIGIATLMTIATAGAGSPVLAAILGTITGKVIKTSTEVITAPKPDSTVPAAGNSEPVPGLNEPVRGESDLKKYLPYLAIAAAIIVIDQNT